MSRFVGARVSKGGFHLEEDSSRALALGVTWRRRRFRFRLMDEPEETAKVGLCINEITIDSNAEAEFRPTLASEHPDLLDFEEVENAYWQTNWATGAIRGGRGTKESRLFLNTAQLLYGRPDRKEALLDAVRQAQDLGAYNDEIVSAGAELDPTLFEAEPSGDYHVARYLPAFPPSRLVQSSDAVLAATNAGYFLNFPEEYDDGISSLHQPVGGHMADGRLVAPPWIQRPGVLAFEGGGVKSALFGPDDMVLESDLGALPLHRWRAGKPWNGAVVRHFDDLTAELPPGAVQLSYCGPVLVRVVTGPALASPPLGGATVILEEEWAQRALQPDGSLAFCVRLRDFTEGTPRWMICSGPFLVRGSQAIKAPGMFEPGNAGEFYPGGPAPTRFPYDADKTKAPRTAMGVLPSGGTKIVVVDGRRSREHSLGVDLAGMAAIMERVGCGAAINLDGGGSSVLAVEGADGSDMLQEHLAHGVVNVPSDEGGRERIVPVILAVQRTNNG